MKETQMINGEDANSEILNPWLEKCWNKSIIFNITQNDKITVIS